MDDHGWIVDEHPGQAVQVCVFALRCLVAAVSLALRTQRKAGTQERDCRAKPCLTNGLL